MVITNNKYYANKIERLKMVGVVKNKFYWHNMIGYNYRMTNICAAIGCAQLKNAKKILKSKKKIFESYFSNLKELPIKIHKQSKNTIHSYWIITLTLQKKGLRDKLIAYLKKFKIETRPAFYLVHEMPMYISKKRELFAGADFISKNSINLPSGPNLTKKQIKFVTDKIRDFLDKN